MTKLYKYVSVLYMDEPMSGKEYNYKTNISDIEEGDIILVDRNGYEVEAEVTDIRTYKENEVPFPLDKTKDVIKVIERDGEPMNCKELFYEVYQLSNPNRNIDWGLSYSVINPSDKVLVQGRYFADIYRYHFYIIEKNNRKYLRIINIRNIEDEMDDICYDYFDGNMSWSHTISVGIFLPEYKKLVQDRCIEILLDDDINNILDNMKNTDFSNFFLEGFTCIINPIKYDCYDFYGKHVFYADGYCLTKYKAYVDLIDYIFKISKVAISSNFKIKLVDNFDEAYKEAVLEKKDQENWIM